MPRLDIETRRTQLIDAAIRIALRDGLDNTTVRRIATEAGVSLGTVHYCFDSKRALLEAVVESLVTRQVEAGAFELPQDATLADGIKHAFRAYWSLSGAQPERQRLLYELVAYLVRQEDPGPELARRIFTRNYDVVLSVIDVLRARGSYELKVAPEIIARMVVALTDGVALAWLADADDGAALTVLDTFAMLVAAQTEAA